jgi:hypothetical protein
MPLPTLHWMPRAKLDIKKELNFIRRQPWGKPEDRELDIWRGVQNVLAHPEGARRERYLPRKKLWLRRGKAAQFVIVYALLPPKDPKSPGVVSIRAVRHRREADVFKGVKERLMGYGP